MSRRRQWGEDSTILLELSAGASITISFKGNLFDLKPEERALIGDLSHVVEAFKDVQNGQLQTEPGKELAFP